MKKFVSFLAMVLLNALPLTASATPLGSGDLHVDWSSPYAGGYYADYDGTVDNTTFPYAIDDEISPATS